MDADTVQALRDAKALFDRYDNNNDGFIDRVELTRMLSELDRERLQLSETLKGSTLETCWNEKRL